MNRKICQLSSQAKFIVGNYCWKCRVFRIFLSIFLGIWFQMVHQCCHFIFTLVTIKFFCTPGRPFTPWNWWYNHYIRLFFLFCDRRNAALNFSRFRWITGWLLYWNGKNCREGSVQLVSARRSLNVMSSRNFFSSLIWWFILSSVILSYGMGHRWAYIHCFLFCLVDLFLLCPPPQFSEYILFATPEARAIFSANDFLCNATRSLTGGGQNVLVGTNGKDQ